MLCHLIQLRKLLSQKSEHNREHDRVRDNRDLGSLTGHHRPGGDREKHTGTQSHEQRRCREEVCLCKNETHSFRDERVRKEKHETVEENGHLVCADILECELRAIRLEDHTRAEREE